MFKFGRNNAGSSGNIANAPPTGEIATAILDVATNPAAPEVEWGAVFSTMELIKAFYSTSTPGEGCSQALKAIRYRLSSEDPVAINYILQVMDAFYKNCEQQFTSQVASKDFLNFLKSVLERPSLAAENRGQLLELIADWGTANPAQPEMRKFFESCVKDGYKFSESALAKLPPATLQTLRSNSNKGGIFYGAINSWSTTGVPQQNYMIAQQIPAQQFMRPQAPVQPKINEVPYSERVNWIKFDVDVADNCVSMLLETVNFADQSSDVGKNEIAKETFMRCCDIQRRIVSSISKVDEPDLVEKLLSTNRKINDALEQFNNRRLAFSKRFAGADPLIDFGELRESLPPAAPAGPLSTSPPAAAAAAGYQIGSGASSSRPAAEDPFSDQAAAGAAGPSNHRI